ncbi:hypothetical protein [Halobacteriovorax sp. RT-2-4]|uniref:hypothetical protein n=1 Tax=unclassified Halobacteriovorax TaxID=2639665 RepID=UPI00399BDA9C
MFFYIILKFQIKSKDKYIGTSTLITLYEYTTSQVDLLFELFVKQIDDKFHSHKNWSFSPLLLTVLFYSILNDLKFQVEFNSDGYSLQTDACQNKLDEYV